MTEVFIDSTFGTNKLGYELYCVLAEYDLVSLPLSYLLLDTRKCHRRRQEKKRGIRVTRWFAALRGDGLNPNVVHTDKDFAASILSPTIQHNHRLCLWHSLRAIDQQIKGKVKDKVYDSTDIVRNSICTTALPEYLHFLSDESDWILSKGLNKRCSAEQAQTLRSMIKRHLLRHPLLPKVVDDKKAPPGTRQFESYEEINSWLLRKRNVRVLQVHPSTKRLRYFWANWYRPNFGNAGSQST
ncbi:hypothetical protein V1525DRAFT_447241 [Lipomyces kononenkoae]|uniref:Uncharacterized protein n=1 Tax=Lipomyces kononenkoae TaxID=34357 RepID=A0ACC3STU8_LIPKO